MKLSRKGESLWQEWTGTGYSQTSNDTVVFYTESHVSLEEPVVLRALASALQREGIVHSLGEAYAAVEKYSVVSTGYVGIVDGERDFRICSEDGETFYGDYVDEAVPATFIEVSLG
jgi:hypothetical protein